MGGDVFFLLCPVEKGEGKGGDGCCALDVQGFVCRGTSVFVMGPSRNFDFCDEARLSGRTDRALASTWSAHLVSDQIRSGRGWGSVSFSFLTACMRAGSIGVLDDGSDS